MDRFHLKKINKVEVKEQYRVEISERFAALENLDTEVDINRAYETIVLYCIVLYCIYFKFQQILVQVREQVTNHRI
jgi:hypothetical protein